MQAEIHESIQAQFPAMQGKCSPAEEGGERGNCQGGNQKVEGGTSETLLQILDGIDAETAGKRSHQDDHQR